MQEVECELIEDCLAPRRVGKVAQKKAFRRGQRVRGIVSNIALTPDSQVLALKTKEGYLIPEPFLNVLGAVNSGGKKQARTSSSAEGFEYAEVIEEENEPKEKSIANVFNGLKTSDLIKRNSTKSKQVVNFGLGGAVIGVIYAMYKGGNKLIYGAIGAAAGGIIGNYVANKMKENDKSE